MVFVAFVPLEELEGPPVVLHFLAQVGLKEPSTKTDLIILDLCLNYLNLGLIQCYFLRGGFEGAEREAICDKKHLKRWPGPRWLLPQKEIPIMFQLIMAIVRTKLAISFMEDILLETSEFLKEIYVDCMVTSCGVVLAFLFVTKVFMKNYQQLFQKD